MLLAVEEVLWLSVPYLELDDGPEVVQLCAEEFVRLAVASDDVSAGLQLVSELLVRVAVCSDDASLFLDGALHSLELGV